MNGFPHNVGGLLPIIYYSQFRDWYSHMVILEALLTDSSKQWLTSFSFVNENTIKEKLNVRGGDHVNRNNDFRSNQRGNNGHYHDNSSRLTNHSNNYCNSHANDNCNENRNKRSSFSYESDRGCRHAPCYDSHSRSRSRSRSYDRSQQTSSGRHRHESDEINARRSRMIRSRSPCFHHDEPSSKRRRVMFGN